MIEAATLTRNGSERSVFALNIALIAHDRKKDEMVNCVTAYAHVFSRHNLYATGTTGARIMEKTGLKVHRFMSGPLGGDQQIGAMVAQNEMDLIVFLRDPLMAQPHEPDIIALLRLCDVKVSRWRPTSLRANCWSKLLDRGDFAWGKSYTSTNWRKLNMDGSQETAVDLLVFGAHPDDAEIGMGGTIAKHAALGLKIAICDLTEAELSSNGDVKTRQREAERAARVLGVAERSNLRLPDRGLDRSRAQLDAVTLEIRRLRPKSCLHRIGKIVTQITSPAASSCARRCSMPSCATCFPRSRHGQ